MSYLLDASYSEDDSYTMLSYFGPGDGPMYCGERKDDDEFNDMLEFYKGDMCDFIHVNPGVMACSERVGSLLKEEVPSDEAQLLPIHVQGINLFLINVTRVIDVIDHERTNINFFPSGRIMDLDPCVIDEASVPESSFFFKIPQVPCRSIFGTEQLKALVEAAGFTGLRFMALPVTT